MTLLLLTMNFSSIPNEIILEIADRLSNRRDISSLTRVSWRFHHLLDEYLHCYNIKCQRSSALLWAAENGRESTARKLLRLGADVNVDLSMTARGRYRSTAGFDPLTKRNRSWSIDGTKPLILAAYGGHLSVVDLLLDFGAAAEVQVADRWTPLFFALQRGDEKMAHTISRRIGNPQNCLVDSSQKLTPLHVSCGAGLYGYARHLLEKGAEVDAKDEEAATPLYHALQ